MLGFHCLITSSVVVGSAIFLAAPTGFAMNTFFLQSKTLHWIENGECLGKFKPSLDHRYGRKNIHFLLNDWDAMQMPYLLHKNNFFLPGFKDLLFTFLFISVYYSN